MFSTGLRDVLGDFINILCAHKPYGLVRNTKPLHKRIFSLLEANSLREVLDFEFDVIDTCFTY